MSHQQQLLAIKSNILDRIQEITLKPKPNYNIDGQQVSWQSYKDSLWKDLDAVEAKIIEGEGPYEEVSRGVT